MKPLFFSFALTNKIPNIYGSNTGAALKCK